MKFKLFGLIWDLSPVIGMLWSFIGLMICGTGFMIDKLGWWNIPYLIITIVYLATAESFISYMSENEKY